MLCDTILTKNKQYTIMITNYIKLENSILHLVEFFSKDYFSVYLLIIKIHIQADLYKLRSVSN